MASKEKTWEERIAHAKKVNSQQNSAGVKNTSAVTPVSSSSANSGKSWEDRISHAKRANAAKQLEEQKKLINSNEYKWASENESRLKKGLGYNVNNGQIYSFEPLTTDSLKKSIDWADSEIEKLKSQGASTDWITAIGNFGLRLGGMEGVDRKELNQQLSDLQSQRAVYQKYLEAVQQNDDVEKIKADVKAENKFGAIFNIDNDKKLFFLNAGENGYDKDSYYDSSVKRDKLVSELKSMGYEDIDRFIKSYSQYRSDKTINPVLEYIEKGIVEHPVLGTAAATAVNTITAPMSGIGRAFDNVTESLGIHGYKASSLPADVSELTKSTVEKVVDEKTDNKFLRSLARISYGAATSFLENSFVNKGFDKMGEAILGLNAATSTYKAGKERGLSDGQALAGGIAAGIFESLFEHMSLENLRMFKASPVTSLKPFIKNVIKQAGIEGIEEIGTDLANEAYDYFVNGGLSQYEEALRSGMTAEEYGKKFGLQLLETGLTGALSGGGMIAAVTAPTAVSGTVNNIISDRASGEFIRQTDEITETLKNAKETGGILGSRAARIEKRITDGKSVSNRTLGEIERKTIKKERASAVDKILASEEFKELSGKEKNAIRSSVLTFFSTEGQVSEEQAEVLKTENGKNALKKAYEWAFNYADSKTEQAKERKSEEIRTAVFEGNTEKLVKNSFDAVNIDGHRVEIGAVKNITDGEFELIQDKETGATAKLSEIRIEDEEIGGLYTELQKSASEEIPMTVEAVNVALAMYNRHDNISGEAYAKWAYDAFKAGSLKINDTILSFSEYEEMMRGDISKGESNYTSDITKSQLRQMYELGAKSLVTKPGVTKIGTRGLSKFQAEQVFVLSERAKKLGLEIVLVTEKLSDGDGRAVNALYMEGTNRVVLSLQSDLDLLLVHAGHEIFHWAKSQNKEMTQHLQNMVINVLKSDNRYDYEGIYNQVSAEYEGLSEEEILEEIAAQYMGVVFADESSIRKTVEEASEQERGFLKKVIDYLKDFIKSLKELIRIYGDRDKAVRAAVETPVEQLEYFAETFERILAETAAKKKPATDEGGVKASLSISDNDSIKQQLKTNIKQISTMDTVASIEFADMNKKELREKAVGEFKKFGYVVDRQNFGRITIGPDEIRDGTNYINTPGEKAALLCVPKVLKRGIVISEHQQHKNRLHDTITIAAPVEINGDIVCVAVTVKRTSKNKYHAHRVLTFSGEKFVLKEIKNNTKPTTPGLTAKNDGEGPSIGSVPNSSLAQNEHTVNNNAMQNKKKFSRTLSSETKEKVLKAYDIANLNDSIEVQRKVFSALQKSGFFTDEARVSRVDVNEESGMEIETNKSGINETFSYKNFVINSNDTKIIKLATITSLPSVIKRGKLIYDNVKNAKKDNSGVKYAYLIGSVTVDGNTYDVKLTIRKSLEKNKFWVHHIYIKNDTAVASDAAQLSESSALQTNGVNESVSQGDGNVNKKYSRQRINESWEDIRTKMYENEVHEEIIGEIEAYIDRLKNRKLERETEITEGLIPKYEAILKVAREYTKGSDVSAHQLADTINELMWAAHDGNLDTKQFIATVRLITEDIIRTGRKINDDKYRQYEDFRRMTREETVFVERRVYNQYVEEYGSVKNLNRACAGKIRIKPYEDGNRTGRALDDFYGELREVFPELIREEKDVYHQLYEILAAWNDIQPTTEYFSEMLGIKTEADIQTQSLIVAEDILSDVLGIKEAVKTLADKYANKLKYQQEHYKELYRKKTEEGRRNRREAEERALLNKRITRNTNRLSDMLRNETDERHIPENFKNAVKEFLNIFIAKNEEGREVFVNKGTLNMVNLGNAYKAYYAGEAGSEMTEYDEDILGWINELAVVFGQDINIKKLSIENLRKVDNIVTHFCHIIKTENEIFINGRREKFTDWANTSINEMWNHVKKPEYETEKKILDAEYGMLTPIYFFKLIGTTTKNGTVYEEKLFKMFRDLQDGQDKWFRNISSVKDELAEIKEKYQYSEDWKRDAKEFTLSSGETIKLTVEEILYMRALNIRETGHINRLCHLLEGGIIVENDGRLRSFAEKKQGYQETKEARAKFDGKQSFSEDDITTALKKNITYEDLIKIFATLTENQEAYSEALVDMLSTKGSELGNEVSLELVGIRKFTEKNYIPISVAESFLKFSVDKRPGGAIRLKNRSFTKRTTQNANATVYVRSITDIAAEHMQEMSLYNAMTIPIENLTRVFNYQKPDQEEFTAEGVFKKTTGNSYKELFEAVYGKRGIQYFENFLEDINGGNQTVSRDFMSKMMGMFKKSAVTGSLSVAIQQPSAIVRATALIDPKYFVTKPYSQEDYNEMLRYCPVAGIKEIGRFDTGTGLTATEWILNEKGGFKDKADEFLSYLPGWMDRRTWVYIWEAVKKETADKTNKKGEDLLKEAAERFRDVIDYTQVYDSTLSRSAYMRDKGTGARMATAFLAEPTLSYNMVRDALINAKNDKKQAARSVAAFAGATLLNALLKSVITALRQDDEETNYFELYLSEVPQSFIEDVIIVNSLPVVKDIISIFKGYDVSRSDMTLFSNAYNAFRVILKEDHVATWDEWFVALGALSALVGIPLNNVLKDFTAVVKTVGGLVKSPDFSGEVLGQTIAESFIGKKDDSVKLYRAILNGNKKIVERYLEIDERKVKEYKKQGYSEADALAKVISNSESNFHSKVVEGLISEDIRIKEAAEARLASDTEEYEKLIEELAELGFEKNDIIKAIDKYIESMKDKSYKASESKDKALYSYEDLFRAIDSDNIKSAKYIFEELTKTVSKATVQNNIRDEYSEALYIAILNGDKAEQERLQKIFKEFEYDHHYAVILGLRENDERIYEAAEARYKGDFEEYESIKEELLSDGFDENDIFNAVEAEAEKLAPSEEKKESHPESSYLYEAADLKRYAESFNLTATKRAIQNFRDGGKEDSGIRSSLTSVFKKKYIEAWQSGNDALIIKIRDFLIDCDVGYSSKQFSSWEKEALGK